MLFKVLDGEGRACHGGSLKWPLPTKGKNGKWKPGKWVEVEGKLIPCKNGLHLCRPQDLCQWLNETIYEAEVEGEQIIHEDKVVARKARLLRKMEKWTKKTARLFACECAERVLPIFEKECRVDKRLRRAIETARKFANGRASKEDLAAARAAAGAAERGTQAWAAALAVSGAVSGDAARAAERGIQAMAAAWAAERKWQTDRLLEILGVED